LALRLIVEEALVGEVTGSPGRERDERGEGASTRRLLCLNAVDLPSRLHRSASTPITTMGGIDPLRPLPVGPEWAENTRRRP
jgi:hypothetical protein